MTVLVSISGAGQAWLRSRRSRDQLRSLSPAPSNVPTSAFIATCKSAEDWQSLEFSSGCTSVCWHALWIRASYSVCWRYGNDNLKTTMVRFPLCKDLCNNWAFFALFSCKAHCCSVRDVFVLFFFFLSEGTPDSLPQSYHTPPLPPQALSPGGPHAHIPMTFPRVPPHVFFGQHILSASKFNRDQVTWQKSVIPVLTVISHVTRLMGPFQLCWPSTLVYMQS